MYFNPAVTRAKKDGLGTLGQFICYDAMVNQGPGMDATSFGGIRDAALAMAAPSQGRRRDPLPQHVPRRPLAVMKADPTWAQTTVRIDTEQRKFLNEGNLSLQPPLAWSTYGDDYRINPKR